MESLPFLKPSLIIFSILNSVQRQSNRTSYPFNLFLTNGIFHPISYDPVWDGPISTLTLYSIITPFNALKYHIFENIRENGAFAPFSIIFKSSQNFTLIFLEFFNVV